MKINLTRRFLRRSVIYSIVAVSLVAAGCAGKATVREEGSADAEKKAREEAERKKWADVGQRADEAWQKKTVQSVEEAIRLWESMPESMRPVDKLAAAKAWLADAKAKAEAERKKAEAEAKEREARVFPNVFFDYDKYSVRDDQRTTLATQLEKLQARPDFKVTVEGHCDERGTIEYNLALGQRRAESHKGYLVKAGIDAARVSTVSYGKERPVDLGHNETAWAKNRRTETKVTEPALP